MSDEFQEHRQHLWAVAYRITGTVGDADDAVQEAWLRWQGADRGAVVDSRAFLTTVVSRICYDTLTSARARRESYVGQWLPEPLLARDPGPEARITMDESVSVAMLAVLERLSPAERIALVLHDVFAVPFDEIAGIVGSNAAAVRQAASRARRQVQAHGPRRSVDLSAHRKAVAAFLAAVENGDLPGLVAVLDPEVVWRADGGGVVNAARVPVLGRDKVSRLLTGLVEKFYAGTGLYARSELVNTEPGLVILEPSGAVNAVLAFSVAEGLITEVDVLLNPDKLSHLSA
ncbi:RNA polymerase sigma factor SigJ [Amycolatopsis palatopharyngis]|uniref:RNA polymerase sigma factor SigJ n=1 Tax=Amycolatopsis palatopharyngis TaxID=187982 RepID=UPI001B879324|nr:RNA polymerase sigma factor SigJ [Amycolatopsis palatopharyngis]